MLALYVNTNEELNDLITYDDVLTLNVLKC